MGFNSLFKGLMCTGEGGAIIRGAKQSESAVEHLILIKFKFKNPWSCASTQAHIFIAWCSVKERGIFSLYLFILISTNLMH